MWETLFQNIPGLPNKKKYPYYFSTKVLPQERQRQQCLSGFASMHITKPNRCCGGGHQLEPVSVYACDGKRDVHNGQTPTLSAMVENLVLAQCV